MHPRILPAAAIAALLLAGCTSNATLSAQEGESIATQTTTAQPENLLAAMTTESPAGLDGFGKDAHVGDGRATTWYYAYRTSGLPTIVRVEGSSARIVPNIPGALGRLQLPTDPLGPLLMDSEAAVQTAKTDAGFAGILETDDAILHEAVGNVEGTTVWLLVAHAAGRSAFGMVDAAKNQLVQVTLEEGATPEQLFPGSGHTAGSMDIADNLTLTPTARVQDYAFRAIGKANLEVSARKDFATDSLEWAVLDSTDSVTSSGRMLDVGKDSDYQSIEIDLAHGSYTLRFALTSLHPAVPPQGAVDVGFALYPS